MNNCGKRCLFVTWVERKWQLQYANTVNWLTHSHTHSHTFGCSVPGWNSFQVLRNCNLNFRIQIQSVRPANLLERGFDSHCDAQTEDTRCLQNLIPKSLTSKSHATVTFWIHLHSAQWSLGTGHRTPAISHRTVIFKRLQVFGWFRKSANVSRLSEKPFFPTFEPANAMSQMQHTAMWHHSFAYLRFYLAFLLDICFLRKACLGITVKNYDFFVPCKWIRSSRMWEHMLDIVWLGRLCIASHHI